MARTTNTFMASLAERVGTGIQARADEAGNHVFSSTLVDSYAQAGQVVPTNLQGAIRELNDITRSETLLSQADPTARANLRGAGYDAEARRTRVADLEQFLLDNSAEVRNLRSRLENEMMTEQVRDLEMTNVMNARTLDSRVAATISTNEMAVTTNQQQMTSIERAAAAQKVVTHTMNSGFSTDELYAVWTQNDPTILRSVFGTADRASAHDALMLMTSTMNEGDALRMTGMANAVTIQAHTLASDATITTQELTAYASGTLQLPPGTSMLAIGEALGARAAIEQNRVALQTMGVQTEENAVVLAELATASMSPLEKISQIATALGMDPSTVQDALYNDPAAAAILAKRLGQTPQMQLTTASGTVVTIAPQTLLESITADIENQQAAALTTIATNVNMRRFMEENNETSRIVETTMAMAVGLPSETRVGMTLMMQQSNDLFVAAAREQDPVRQAALVTTAQQAAQQARDLAAEAMRRSGAPEYLIQDLAQGRFSSVESVKAAQVSAAGFGSASFRGHPFGAGFAALLEEKGIRPVDFDSWAADPTASLTDLSRNRLFGESRITDEDIVSIVTAPAGYMMGNIMLDAMMTSIWADSIPTDALAILEPLTNGEVGAMSPLDYQQRIVHAAALMERMILSEQDAAARSGVAPPGPQYQQGAMLRVMQDALNNNAQLTNFLSGTPNGIPSREMAGLLTEFNRIVLGVPTHGEGATNFEDIIPATVQALQTTFTQNLAGQSLVDMGRVSGQVRARAMRYGLSGGGTGVMGMMGTSGRGFDTDAIARSETPGPQQREARAAVEMAILRIMTRDAVDPDRPANSIIGRVTTTLSGGPTAQAIEAELQTMGMDPTAVRTAMRARN